MSAERNLDGCPAFDAALLEQALAPAPDARLDAHLATCARCRAARDRYLASVDAVRSGFALEEADDDARARTRRPSIPARIAAVAALVLALASVAVWLTRGGGPEVDVVAGEGAEVRVAAPGDMELTRGSARFRVRRGPLRLATPAGEVACDEGVFDVRVGAWLESDGPKEDDMRARGTVGVVAVAVVGGAVWWAQSGEEADGRAGVRLTAGERLERTVAPDEAELATPAPLPDPGAVGPKSAAAVPRADAGRTPAPEVGQAPPFSIAGTVTDAATEAPIAGAEVVLVRVGRSGARAEARGTSGGDGRFAAPAVEVPPGDGASADEPARRVSFVLRASAPGYVTDERPWHGARKAEPGAVLTLDVRLEPGARVRGRVVDADERPVDGAAILLAREIAARTGSYFRGAEEVARSDGDGRFELPRALGPSRNHDDYLVTAFSERGVAWEIVPVVEGRRELDLVLRLRPAFPLEVRVTDPGGLPIEGALVTAEPRIGPFAPHTHRANHRLDLGANPAVLGVFQARTDPFGTARFPGLPVGVGVYDLIGRAEGWAVAWLDDVQPSPEPAAEELVLHPFRTCTVSGVVSSAGVPVEGAEVRLSAAEGTRATGALGAYAFEAVDPSVVSAVLEVEAEGFVPARVPFELDPTGDVELDVELLAPTVVAGRVVDTRGLPIEGAAVQRLQMQGSNAMVVGGVRTGPDGAFRLEGVPAGPHSLLVQPGPNGEWADEYVRHEVTGGDESVEIVVTPAGERASARLDVEVVDAATGLPADPEEVMVLYATNDGPPRYAALELRRTTGRITAPELEVGPWRVWVISGATIGSLDVEVRPGDEVVGGRIELRGPGSVRGRVTLAGGTGPEGHHRMLTGRVLGGGSHPGGPKWGGGPRAFVHGTLEDDGTFAFDRLMAGSWALTLRHEGWLGTATFDVEDGEETVVELEVRPAATLAVEGDASWGAGWMRYLLHEEDGAGEHSVVRRVPGGESFTHRIPVAEGSLRWSCDFMAAGSAPGTGVGAPVRVLEEVTSVRGTDPLEIVLPPFPGS